MMNKLEYTQKTAKINQLVATRAEPRRNIKELFADFHGEYIPIAVNWDSPVGEEIW